MVIAEERGFTRAATRLRMSQPLLTNQIAALEEELGFALLIRARSGLRLTEEGGRIYPAARELAKAAENFGSALAVVCANDVDVVRLDATLAAMRAELPQFIRAFAAEHQVIKVDVSDRLPSAVFDRLSQGQSDVAIVPVDMESCENFRVSPLEEDRLVLAVPSKHRLTSRRTVALAELESEPFVAISQRSNPLHHAKMLATLRHYGLIPTLAKEVESIDAVFAQISFGEMISLVSSRSAQLAPPNVTIVPIAEDISFIRSSIVWRANETQPSVLALVKAARQWWADNSKARR